MIKLIVAIAKNNVIGQNNKLAWHIKEELNFFKKMTLNNYVLFGRKTFLGIPKNAWLQRKVIIYGRHKVKGFKNILNEKKLLKLFKKFQNNKKNLFICGGKYIYDNYFHFAQEIYISYLKKSYKGNVFLNLDLSNYQKSIFKKYEQFTVYKYTKK